MVKDNNARLPSWPLTLGVITCNIPSVSLTLRSEIKQTAPFVSPEQEVFLSLIRTAALLEHAVEEGLRPYSLTLTQYNALRILRGAGSAGLCRNEIGDRLIRPVPDTTRLLDRLVVAGLIERAREGDDRRFVRARISKRGLALLKQIDGPLADLHRTHLGHVSRPELRRLADLLATVRSTR